MTIGTIQDILTRFALEYLDRYQDRILKKPYQGPNRQLPGHHFPITFTVAEQLRALLQSNQRKADTAIFTAFSQTLKAIAADNKYMGSDLPVFLGVLHTWGRTMQYHPQIH